MDNESSEIPNIPTARAPRRKRTLKEKMRYLWGREVVTTGSGNVVVIKEATEKNEWSYYLDLLRRTSPGPVGFEYAYGTEAKS